MSISRSLDTATNPAPPKPDLLPAKYCPSPLHKQLINWTCVSFVFLLSGRLQAGWELQNVTSRSLWDISMVDSNRLWVAGDTGTILMTANGGNTWNSQNSGTNKDLHAVCFVGPDSGWVVGDNGTILRTTNGGQVWIPQTSGTYVFLSDVNFIDSHSGWILGYGMQDHSLRPIILRTNNGGEVWSPVAIAVDFPTSVFFSSADTGWITGSDGTIRKTIDAGDSWVLQNSGTTLPLYDIRFIDGQTGWAVGNNGIVLRTIDGGENWSTRWSPWSFLYSVYFIDPDTGWVVGINHDIYRTCDGGLNWVEQIGDGDGSLECVRFANARTGWIVGNGGTILKTNDGGGEGSAISTPRIFAAQWSTGEGTPTRYDIFGRAMRGKTISARYFWHINSRSDGSRKVRIETK